MTDRTRGRTWTLATLDRAGEYRMYFDPYEYRWEVTPLTGGAPLRTRPTRRTGAQRSERRDGAAAVDAATNCTCSQSPTTPPSSGVTVRPVAAAAPTTDDRNMLVAAPEVR